MLKSALLILLSFLFVSCASSIKHVDYGPKAIHQEPEFQWPVYGASLTQRFRPNKKRHRRRHQGIDLAAPKNTPIYSIDHGVVVYAGHGFTGYGRLVIIEHLNKSYNSYYAHLSRYKVERGDVVKKGDLIGLMGRSGRATGVHLHFEIRRNNMALNPLDYLPSPATSTAKAAP